MIYINILHLFLPNTHSTKHYKTIWRFLFHLKALISVLFKRFLDPLFVIDFGGIFLLTPHSTSDRFRRFPIYSPITLCEPHLHVLRILLIFYFVPYVPRNE